jgi:hypothetical protein
MMGEAKVRRKRKTDNEATAEELARMMRSQAGTVTQDDIPPSLNVFATMEAAWADMLTKFPPDFPQKLQEDAKFIFYHGIQAAANLCIYCAGQAKFEAAADQIIAECVAYEKEAEAVCRRRAGLTGPDGPNGAAVSH